MFYLRLIGFNAWSKGVWALKNITTISLAAFKICETSDEDVVN